MLKNSTWRRLYIKNCWIHRLSLSRLQFKGYRSMTRTVLIIDNIVGTYLKDLSSSWNSMASMSLSDALSKWSETNSYSFLSIILHFIAFFCIEQFPDKSCWNHLSFNLFNFSFTHEIWHIHITFFKLIMVNIFFWWIWIMWCFVLVFQN